MSSRKHQLPTTLRTEKDHKYTKSKDTHNIFNLQLKSAVLITSFLIIWFLLISFWLPSRSAPVVSIHTSTDPVVSTHTRVQPKNYYSHGIPSAPICQVSLRVYVYDLPPEFNFGLLNHCRHLNVYTDMCPHVANFGLGQPITSVNDSKSWFATHQFIAEMIFHARVENHPCRTSNPDEAKIFYVPFYGGLHSSSKFREPNVTARDELAVRLMEYLKEQVWWKRHQGRDHFLALGRTSWDFMRSTTSGTDFGANSLLNMPPVLNMSVLTVERNPWRGTNQFGIPYPSYFHPHTRQELVTWQERMRRSDRSYLFSFIGAPRKGVEKAAIRDELIKQCGESTRCNLMKCGRGASKCHQPMEVLKMMMESEFCLQAPGDSFTRRSTFDSVLAGCIPVFFSPHTAYTQYEWYLPTDRSGYSVYIDEGGKDKNRIEKVLMKIPESSRKQMRERVIDLIPKLTYVHPNSTDNWSDDAVSVALSNLSKRVAAGK